VSVNRGRATLIVVAAVCLIAGIYASIRAALEKKGTPIGAHDMLIAAHARALDAVCVTDNVAEFRRVPALVVENWLR
jgi:tRNA(fMet)-specific endonuclease VapC